jgi:hypothetical protein
VQVSAARLGHIFRDAPGHVNPLSAAGKSRYLQLFEGVASDPSIYRPDGVVARIIPQAAADNGVQAFTKVMRNGEQVWVTVRNGIIQNAGINPIGSVR